MERVILVDENDNEIGTEEKIKAHQNGGKLHRAFSILVLNSKGELLIQKRASDKYHCPGLWSNTCCSHPRPGETVEEAAHRRLMEECGFDTDLREIFSFIYKIDFDNGLTEREFDHVLIGKYDGEIHPNPEEVEECRWIDMKALKREVENDPEKFTPWFRLILERINFNNPG
ncbi:MAG: isopentenyl-diphosphate Delta-isomerase [Candidatus Aenigmarchaeota archaeon]|nr:isopentenyl-diphosphate Delta-isomerase [Candidatus Aenigmarchaeota archaeon]